MASSQSGGICTAKHQKSLARSMRSPLASMGSPARPSMRTRTPLYSEASLPRGAGDTCACESCLRTWTVRAAGTVMVASYAVSRASVPSRRGCASVRPSTWRERLGPGDAGSAPRTMSPSSGWITGGQSLLLIPGILTNRGLGACPRGARNTGFDP